MTNRKHILEGEGTCLLKIVSVQQCNEQMNWDDNDVVVKEEANYDSDATFVYEPEENYWVSFYITFLL